jgi:hypothetical protein
MRRTLVLTIALSATGCAYQQSLHKAERLARSNQWVEALDAYEHALETKPASEEAQAGADRVLAEAVGHAVTEARAATATGNYESASAAIALLEKFDRDNPESFQLKKDLRTAMTTQREALFEIGDERGAYALAIRQRQLCPDSEGLDQAFMHLREHFLAESERLLALDEHQQALAAIRVIPEFEPNRKMEVATSEQRILDDWADDLDREARNETTVGRLGTASILYARAFEVAGRTSDLDTAQRLAASLAADGGFGIDLQVSGPPARKVPLREAVTTGVGQVVPASAADMLVSITVQPSQCTEARTVTKQSRDYVSGQVEKPNPAYAEGKARLQLVSDSKDEATAAAKELKANLEAAEIAVTEIERGIAAATAAGTEAQRWFTLAETQYTAARTKRDQMAETNAATDDLVGAGKRVDEWSEARDQAEDALQKAEQDGIALSAERGPAAETLARLRAEDARINAERAAATSEEATQANALRQLPATVWEDVHATFNYEVVDWTRTCTAPVEVTLQPRWSTSLPVKRTFAPANATADRTNVAHTASKLEADPKGYPETDAVLLARGDAATTAEIIQWIKRMSEDYYDVRTHETTLALVRDPDSATTSIVGLWLGAPERLDEATRAAFTLHVRERYGLQKLELLASPPPAAPQVASREGQN